MEIHKKDGETAHLYFRIENHIKDRLAIQCERLCLTQAATIKMALVKFLEEEEALQDERAYKLSILKNLTTEEILNDLRSML